MAGKDKGLEEAERGGRKEGEDEEGRFLLGRPTFTSIGNERFKCTETGHEVLAKDMESYGNSKRCRLGLIDAALLHKKPPLNLFEQHPVFKSKLICKLTKDTINKSEEHIWKHISGRRFQNRLEQKEAEIMTSKGIFITEQMEAEIMTSKGIFITEQKEAEIMTLKGIFITEQKEAEIMTSKGTVEQADMLSRKPSMSDINGVKKVRNNKVVKGDSPTKKPIDNNSDTEEPDFWMPPIGSRWDLDDGNDRWGSCTSLAHETDEDAGIVEADEAECDATESESLSMRTKRMSVAVGPSSFASRKKKSKKTGCDQ